MTAPSILIISSEQDIHIRFVTKYLPKGSAIIVDPATFHTGNALTYTLDGDRISIKYCGVSLDTIRSIWYRKPTLPEKEVLPVAASYADYCHSGISQHYQWLLEQFSDALWLSPYGAILKARNKPLQLAIAKRLGFTVPATCITADPAAARLFLATYRPAIIKPIANTGLLITEPGSEPREFFFATRIEKGQKVDLTNLQLAPSIFQQAVEDIVADIRVAVVLDEVFATAITGSKGDHESIRDWRVGHFNDTIRFEPHELPKVIADKCIAHVKALGLNYGAIDLILDTHGTYWFLENNGNGQWAFVDKGTAENIGKAIAKALVAGKT
jgi:glutathione synthase/RimK-type ligase-like ATP-grasp enzyme